MKNLLKMLAVAVLGSAIAVPNITLNNMLINTLNNRLINKYNNEIILPITPIAQESATYCVPACVQMIFTFLGVSLEHFSQAQIYRDLGGDENGIIVDQHVADYLNTNIPSVTNYGANHLADNFGTIIQEQWLFQHYVHESLSNNHPIIFGLSAVGHAILISGIKLNFSDPTLTKYTYIDPADENGEISHFLGSNIPNILRAGGDLIGYGIDPEIHKPEVSVGFDSREIGADWLNDYEDHEVVRIRTDLTATIGATSTGNFANLINKISLPFFKGEIYLFTWRDTVNDFHISTDDVPRNNDSWTSPKYIIANNSENSGSAHIEGRILGQIQFERTKSLNHLLMYFVIYVGGISWSTPNWAHVWFLSGDVLKFSKR